MSVLRKGSAGLKHLLTRQSLVRSLCTGVRAVDTDCSFLIALVITEIPLMAASLPLDTSSLVRMWQRSERLPGLNLKKMRCGCEVLRSESIVLPDLIIVTNTHEVVAQCEKVRPTGDVLLAQLGHQDGQVSQAVLRGVQRLQEPIQLSRVTL